MSATRVHVRPGVPYPATRSDDMFHQRRHTIRRASRDAMSRSAFVYLFRPCPTRCCYVQFVMFRMNQTVVHPPVITRLPAVPPPVQHPKIYTTFVWQMLQRAQA